MAKVPTQHCIYCGTRTGDHYPTCPRPPPGKHIPLNGSLKRPPVTPPPLPGDDKLH